MDLLHGFEVVCGQSERGFGVRRCGCIESPKLPVECSHVHLPVGSLRRKNIDDKGARDLGAALQVNMTLTKLESVVYVVLPRPLSVLTLAHGQPSWQQHRRCRRAGPGRGAASQHDADDAHVRLGCGCGAAGRCGCVAVAVAESLERDSAHTTLASAHLHMPGSLDRNNIGDAGARDLGAALQVNTTLKSLQ
jgi:hypothetical protein